MTGKSSFSLWTKPFGFAPANVESTHSETTASRVLLACVVALYVLAFPYHAGLRSPNELCRLWQTRALVEHGEIRINEVLRSNGYVGDLSRYQGNYYPSKAPLLAFAAVPVLWGLSWAQGVPPAQVSENALVFWARFWLTVLPTLGLLFLIRKFLRAQVPADIADVVTATYALGSLALSYSLLFMSHQTTAVLLFGGFYSLWLGRTGERWVYRCATAGLCAALAVASEYTSVIGILGLIVYALLALFGPSRFETASRGKVLAAGTAGALVAALPVIAGLCAYHSAAFGHPLHSGYMYLNDAAYQPWHLGGFLGIRTPDPRAFFLSLFSPLRGLLVLSPFVVLALGGWGVLWKNAASKGMALFIAVMSLMYLYFTSSFSYDSWGWTTGPRHLTGWIPFLLLPVALALVRLRERSWAGYAAGVGLCAASVLVTGLLTGVNYIPDSVTSPLFGFVLPLYQDGYVPPSVLDRLVPPPVGGIVWLAILLIAVEVMAVEAKPPTVRGWRWFSAVTWVVMAYLGVLALLPRSANDAGAVGHLKSVWTTSR